MRVSGKWDGLGSHSSLSVLFRRERRDRHLSAAGVHWVVAGDGNILGQKPCRREGRISLNLAVLIFAAVGQYRYRCPEKTLRALASGDRPIHMLPGDGKRERRTGQCYVRRDDMVVWRMVSPHCRLYVP